MSHVNSRIPVKIVLAGFQAVGWLLMCCVALVTCRLFIYREGLVRFCTTKYEKPCSRNLSCSFMHLTNYAVNKQNTEAYVQAGSAVGSAVVGDCQGQQSKQEQQQDAASKWSFQQLRQYLEGQGWFGPVQPVDDGPA